VGEPDVVAEAVEGELEPPICVLMPISVLKLGAPSRYEGSLTEAYGIHVFGVGGRVQVHKGESKTS
jgi:hypothetical protein